MLTVVKTRKFSKSGTVCYGLKMDKAVSHQTQKNNIDNSPWKWTRKNLRRISGKTAAMKNTTNNVLNWVQQNTNI